MSALDDFQRELAETNGAPQAPSRTVQRPATPPQASGRRVNMDGVGAFVLGVADTVTFGHLDEAGAWVDSKIDGRSYEQHLAENRAVLKQARDEHGGAHLAGQVAGALVPVSVAGKVSTGVKAGRAVLRAGGSRVAANAAAAASHLGQVAKVGAVEGALYGEGSADGDLHDRLLGAAEGAVGGALGGLVLGAAVVPIAKAGARGVRVLMKKGASTQFKNMAGRAERAAPTEEITPAPKATPEATPAAAPKKPAAPDAEAPAPKLDPEEGSVLHPEELTREPSEVRKTIDARIGKLTDAQALSMVGKLQKAEETGNLIDDPHYRSLLHVGLDGEDIDQGKVLTAAQLFEETTDKLIERAGGGTRTMGSMDHELRERLGKGVTYDDLTDAMDRSRKGITDARVASHVMTLSGVQFVRAKDRLLPLVRKGVEGSREALVNELTKSAQLYAMGKTIVGNTGRALRSLRGDMQLGVERVADDVLDLEDPKAIRGRVQDALKALNDDDLADLIGRMKSADDIERIQTVLNSAENAQAFSWARRARNSVSGFLRSNALTPATGMFNAVSAVMHDFYRNDAARMWAARSLAKAGRMDEATGLLLERKIGNAVYWKAHRQGVQAMLKRVQWEFWGDVERVAGVGLGKGRITTKARAAREAMTDKGYVPPALREYETQPRAAVTDIDAFNQRMDDLKTGGGAFGNLMVAAHRTGAAALNTLDAAGNASMKLFTGAVDDWGRSFVEMKETYAQAARFAFREAREAGLAGKELESWTTRRAVELAEMPTPEIMQRVEDTLLDGNELTPDLRFLASRDKLAETEADRVQFMDGPQTSFGKTSASWASGVDKLAGLGLVEGVVMPYIRTPIRLFERGLVSYTPWGKASEEMQAILRKGGPEAAMAKAQMEMGMHAISAGLLLGGMGALKVTNGKYGNTAGLDEGPPNHLQIGSAFLEVGRLDPFSLTVTIGGMIGQMLREGGQDVADYDLDQGVSTALQIGFLAAKDGILSKSYLTGVRDLMDTLFSDDADKAESKLMKIIGGTTQRAIPLAGTSRTLNDTVNGNATEAVGWVDQMLRAIPGAGMYAPVKRDLLGDPVKGRTFGIAVGDDETTGDGNRTDSVKETLRSLHLDLQDLRASDPRGFKLSAKQLDRLREIRGHEATNAAGATLREALGELFASEEFQQLPSKDQKKDAVADVIRDFNGPAREQLEAEDPHYAAKREGRKSFLDYVRSGMAPDAATTQAASDVEAEGLPDPNL